MLHRKDPAIAELATELGSLGHLAPLPAPVLQALAAAGRVVHLPASWALVSEDTPADSCYVLLSGETEVRHGADIVATLGPGALIGEAALVEHRRRNATVITSTAVRALRLGYDDLTRLFLTHPSLEGVFRAEWERRKQSTS